MTTYSRKAGSTDRKHQFGGRFGFTADRGRRWDISAGGGDFKVLDLIDVGTAGSGVKGGDKGRELTLENIIIIPRPSISCV